MWNQFLLFVAVCAACTKPNPDFCCTTDAACEAMSVDTLRPCDAAQVCVDGACVAPQCQVDGDCSPSAPLCLGGICTEKCSMAADCAGVAGAPICAADGRCVECAASTDCAADRPICDTSGTCRGCAMDSDCPDAICTENDGKCVDRADVLFVASNGTDDTCDYSKPCKTLQYAMGKANSSRNVIHIVTPDLPLGADDVTFSGKIVIDGSQTTLATFAGKAMRFLSGSEITMNDVKLDAEMTDTVVVAGKLVLFESSVEVVSPKSLDVLGGTFSCSGCAIAGVDTTSEISCSSGGYVGLNASTSTSIAVDLAGCSADIEFSKFDKCTMFVQNGLVRAHDDLFIARNPEADVVQLSHLSPGSFFSFNTIVNTNATSGDGSALVCDDSVDANSDIFAFNSTTPHGPNGACAPTHSLYDSIAPATSVPNASDQRQERSAIFASLPSEDFRPAAGSLAIGLGTPTAGETTDLSGQPRPTTPSAGCFEPK